MMIRTYDSDYIVIRQLPASVGKDIYICRRTQETGKGMDREYTVIRVKDISMCQKLLAYFSEYVDEAQFADFVECFTFEGKLNFVFLHSKSPTLMEKLEREKPSFAERLEIANKLLERLFYLNLPPALAADGLVLEHITVSAALDVRFNYELTFLNRLTDYTFREVGLDVKDALRALFASELEKMSCPELAEYLEWLSGGCQSYMEMYEQFKPVYEALKLKTKEDLDTPRTRPFRLWERLRKVLGVLKRLLMIVLVAGALLYLINSVAALFGPSAGTEMEAVEKYNYIGTLDIIDQTVTDETLDGQTATDETLDGVKD